MKSFLWGGGVIAGLAVVVWLASGGRPGNNVEFSGSRVYYTGQATRDDATRLGRYMVQVGWFKPDKPIAVQLDLANRRYVVRFDVRLGAEDKPDIEKSCRQFGAEVSKTVFDGAPVDVALCDVDFKPLRLIAFNPPKPDLPVTVTFRISIGGTGKVAQFNNRSAKALTVKVTLSNPTLGAAKQLVLDLGPGRTVEYGWLEGWHFTSGEKIRVEHADYEPLEATVP